MLVPPGYDKLPRLKRCVKCILPVTVPFIEFDEQGVCNYCRNFRDTPTRGSDALEEVLSSHRRSDGAPDCIVMFSGGRDSSYALHVLKTQCRMTPLAFTYEWGMATDIGRRNRDQMCRKLGVEHVVKYANAQRVRNNIKANITAWLKKPDLGILPLFTAGDKRQFYLVNQLRRQRGIELVVICVNPYEEAYYKTGFAGVRAAEWYRLSFLNRFSLLRYYAKEFLANPSYINSGLLDIFWAYLCYYSLEHDYLRLYEYVPFDENVVNAVLIGQYNWETAPDTQATWRIDDATVAFYHYVYLHVAGFTDFDTFRSNQIRKGVLNREQALALIEQDNKPRFGEIQKYLESVGLDCQQTLRAIDDLPRMF